MGADRRTKAMATVEAAAAAIAIELARPQQTEITVNQLKLCQSVIAQMLASLDRDEPQPVSGIAQMAADQWDPTWYLTSLIIEAEREYRWVISHRDS